MNRWRRHALVVLLAAGVAPAAQAGDVTLFAARASPSDNWGTAYGAALSTTWFHVINLEAEAARHPGTLPEEIMTAFTGSAFVAPPIGKLVPYAGVGIGLFRQSTGTKSDLGILRVTVLGVKGVIKNLIVIRADYRWMSLSGEPLLAMDARLSVGAGLRF